MTTATVDTCTIKVFRESDRWEGVERWWTLPAHVLRELYVATWEVEEDMVEPAHEQFVRGQYEFPVVLVY